MNRVFVLSNTKKPLMPCHPARARELLKKGKAAVYRMQPFTIILKFRSDGDVQETEFKVDPGSKTTGIALVADFKRGRRLIWAANLEHRGQAIRLALESRRSLRRSRRGRKTRYRQARFLNRSRQQGWLPPSLQSRVNNISKWFNRLLRYAPLTSAEVETVRFDMQKMVKPEITGVDYQQGSLSGYEVREYLLEKWHRKCAYCGKQDVPLQVEHIQPRALGGSNRVSNLTLACEPCNTRKGAKPIEQFLAKKPEVLKKILAHAKKPLKDATAVNATRYATGNAVKAIGLPTQFWSGGRTKKNRVSQGYTKDHFIDATCVGVTGEMVYIPNGFKPLVIKAMGRGNRQVTRVNRFGFPCAAPKTKKAVLGIRTGDLVKLSQPKGKYKGDYLARVSAIKTANNFLSLQINKKQRWFSAKLATIVQRGDGYAYSHE
jgi:5-methylcytosine-specific restriction endonuclease McrA